jgi:hypothetical protein
MHIVLIQHNTDRVLEVLNADLTTSHELMRRANGFYEIVEQAVVATRQHDEDEGRYYWEYKFSAFCSSECKNGVDVFVCPHHGSRTSDARLHNVYTVITQCFYVGYILCQPPAVLIDFRNRHALGVS